MATQLPLISPDECQLTGSWVLVDGKVIADETCLRITELTKCHLVRIGDHWSGWETLFVDPIDNRYWELTYPHSGWQGGGPPALVAISATDAAKKYSDLFPEST